MWRVVQWSRIRCWLDISWKSRSSPRTRRHSFTHLAGCRLGNKSKKSEELKPSRQDDSQHFQSERSKKLWQTTFGARAALVALLSKMIQQKNLIPRKFLTILPFLEMYVATDVTQLHFTARMLNDRSVGTNERAVWTQAANERPGCAANQRVQKPDAWLLQLINVTDVWPTPVIRTGTRIPVWLDDSTAMIWHKFR